MSITNLASRLSTLNAAIAAADAAANAQPPTPEAVSWRDQLNAELTALNALPDDQKDDSAFQSAAMLWASTLGDAAAVQKALSADPAFLARQANPLTSDLVAQAVAMFPRRPFMWSSTSGANANMMSELFQEGHRWWLNQPAGTRPALAEALAPLNLITVLLPVTIETRFYAPDAGHASWRVRVRVSPDDISINRHRPMPSTEERNLLGNLRAGWEAAKQEAGPAGLTLDAYLATPNGTALWRTLSNAVQPARAAWLVSSTAAADLNGLPVDDAHHSQRVDGFPDRIEVWIVRGAQPGPEQIGVGSPVKRDELVFNLSKDDMQAWWNSWDKAVELGIGIECSLPGEPEQIESLYVVGVSDENPAQLFADKAASGDLAVLEPGAPTNTVHGEPAANLAKDPDTWQQLAEHAVQLAAANQPNQTAHSGALTGRADALPPFPSPDLNPNPDELAQIMIGALFPALWGHAFKDLWGLGEGAERLGAWMFAWVRPEGHLLPIRSGDQPYGLVPVSSQIRWEHSLFETRRFPGLDLVEPDLNKAAARLRDGLARAARANGSTVDADTQTLMKLVGRTPTAVGYSYQPYLPVSLIEDVLRAIPGLGFDAARQAELEKKLVESYRPGSDVRGDNPKPFYTAVGDVRDIHMPLILPRHFAGIPPEKAADLPIEERVRQTITVLKQLEDVRSVDGGVVKELFGGVLPDSLLFRLLIQSALQAKADAAQAGLPQAPGHGTGPRLEDPINNTRPLLYQWTSQMTLNDNMQVDLNSQAGRISIFVHKSVDSLIELLQGGLDEAFQARSSQPLIDLVARMERVFKNVLDMAATRIDPFVTALAWRRLNTLRGETSTSFRLGIYGWVDSPKRGKDGPLPGGMLHAPSQAQLVTSIILRDRYLTERGFDGGAGKAWQMSITSRHVRMAEDLAEEVRMGGHIREILGRRVEAIVGDPVKIQQLRTTTAPLRAASPDRFTVCNGEAVLDLFVKGNLVGTLSADPGTLASQHEQLQAWVEALDVYADLLVAQGVQQAVTRRTEAGSGTMNAAAGTGLPPNLEVIQTPRAGQSLLTSVLVVLPFVDTPALAAGQEQAAHPAQLADASTAAYVDATFGPPESWKWSFHLTGQRRIPGGGVGGGDAFAVVDETQDITLADLTMTPMDAALFPPDRLRFAVEQAVVDHVTASIPDLVRLEVDHTQPIPAPDGDRHRLAREVIAAISGAPFEFNRLHVSATPERASQISSLDSPIRQNLLDRLTALVTAAAALSAVLADPAQAEAGLRLALRWGIVPVDASQPVEERAQLAAGALEARIQTAQEFLAQASAVIAAPMANAAAPNAAGKTPQASAGQIAEAIKELATPEGQLAILSEVSKDDLVNYEPGHALQAAPKLDEAWLTVVAPLRAPLARLEALQLEQLRASILGKAAAFNGFTTYANRPDDPWQKGPVSENRDQSRTTGRAFQPSRLIAAYGTADALNGGRTAAGSIDSWGETVPEPRHTTQAGFHFNAPGARAPQAVLIAVPPVVDQPVDTRTLLDVVRETRDLAHARMAALEDLAEFNGVLPSAMLSTPDPWNRILLDDGTAGP